MAAGVAALAAVAALRKGVRLLVCRRTVQSIGEYADAIRGPRGEDFNDTSRNSLWRRLQGSPCLFPGRPKLSRLGGQYRRSGDGLGGRRLWLRIPRRPAIPRLCLSRQPDRETGYGNLPTHAAALASSRGLGIPEQEGRPFPRSRNRRENRRAGCQDPDPSDRLPGGNTSVD